jgi:Protein of unknown function (DUF3828)
MLLPISLVVASLLLAAPAAAAEDRSPTATPGDSVQSFYGFHVTHEMGFSKEAVSQRKAWLSPDLLSLCRKYFLRPSSPDEVPPIDGDPFTDSQEYPTAFRVEKVRLSRGIATVAVSFSGPEAQKGSVHVVLVPVKGEWLIHDVRYVSGPSFRTLLSR